MLRDITFGQYYPVKSIIHKLDPRVKLAGTCLYIIAIFFITEYIGYVAAGIILAALVGLSKVPFVHIMKGLKPVIILIILTAIFPLFTTPGKELVTFWSLSITLEGIFLAIARAMRLVFLIISSSIMMYTTTPKQLTDGIEKSLNFLNKIKVPVHDVALIMSLALRFIPILMEEADKIIKAQSSRGMDFEEGKFVERMKNMVSILVPLLVSAIKRADDLALAMDARCYHGGEGRTKMRPLRYNVRDYVAYLTVFVMMSLIIFTGRYPLI